MAAILSPKDLAELLEKDNKVVLLQAAINPQVRVVACALAIW